MFVRRTIRISTGEQKNMGKRKSEYRTEEQNKLNRRMVKYSRRGKLMGQEGRKLSNRRRTKLRRNGDKKYISWYLLKIFRQDDSKNIGGHED